MSENETSKEPRSTNPPETGRAVNPSGGGGSTGGNVANQVIDNGDPNGTQNAPFTVQLARTSKKLDPDVLLWYIIQKSSEGISFGNYQAFMDYLLCGDESVLDDLNSVERQRVEGPKYAKANSLAYRRFLPYTDTDAYRILKIATEAFLTVNCAIPFDQGQEGFDLFTGDNLGEIFDLPNQLSGRVSGNSVYDLIDDFWGEYLQTVNGVENPIIPYLALIRNKLAGTPVIDHFFGELDARPELTTDSQSLRECYGIIMQKLAAPCFTELIWSYWHEQGMLVQTMNALSQRFQNVREPSRKDPLASIEIDPIRPLNNLMWGYVQDEQHRLSVVRRSFEYEHQYGLRLEGKAIPNTSAADRRSRFVEAFHNLLNLVSAFYRQDDDNTVDADPFPILKALEDLHLLLSEGAHNQFGDLPSTARIEMLMQQWLLARPEFREVLPRRIMVAYPEPWMDSVDAMKRLQDWTDTSVLHFRHLGVYGERILLSIRFGDWSNTNLADRAGIWARFFRNDIQGYIHAYRTVTGVDLAAASTSDQQRTMLTTSPSVLLRERLLNGRKQPALTDSATMQKPQGFRARRATRQLEQVR